MGPDKIWLSVRLIKKIHTVDLCGFFINHQSFQSIGNFRMIQRLNFSPVRVQIRQTRSEDTVFRQFRFQLEFSNSERTVERNPQAAFYEKLRFRSVCPHRTRSTPALFFDPKKVPIKKLEFSKSKRQSPKSETVAQSLIITQHRISTGFARYQVLGNVSLSCGRLAEETPRKKSSHRESQRTVWGERNSKIKLLGRCATE